MTVTTHNDLFILETDPEHGILQITLDDPASRNALSLAMLKALHDTILSAGQDDTIRLIIIAATGPAFCAGHDLKELNAARQNADKGRAQFTTIMQSCSALMQALIACPKPIIAQIDGVATAAGCQLVASCDLAIASDISRFSTPGVHIGLFCSTPMVALSRNVSRKQAMEMLLTGDMISAQYAQQIGLINHAVAQDQLAQVTRELAQKIASKSSLTLKTGKRAFYEQLQMPLSDAYDYTAQIMTENLMAYDAEEGIKAFIEKRDAGWQDR